VQLKILSTYQLVDVLSKVHSVEFSVQVLVAFKVLVLPLASHNLPPQIVSAPANTVVFLTHTPIELVIIGVPLTVP